jgi:iron-sulfur cluster repair protein YtfE (RIC family)
MKTEPAIRPDMTVSVVLAQFPKTLPVLARHRIDLCCGGDKTLAFVAEAHRLDLGLLLRELDEAR